VIRSWGISRLWGVIWSWGWGVIRSWGWGVIWSGGWGVIRSWGWGVVWSWCWMRFWGMVWSRFWGMVWSWTMVRFLFWVADFAFVFYISMELFVFIYEVIDNSGTAIILYNLVLSFNDLSIAFFVS